MCGDRTGVDHRVLFRGQTHGTRRDRIVRKAGRTDTDGLQHVIGTPLFERQRVGKGFGNRHQREPHIGIPGDKGTTVNQRDCNRQVVRIDTVDGPSVDFASSIS